VCELSRSLGNKVVIRRSPNGKGSITLAFNTDQDLVYLLKNFASKRPIAMSLQTAKPISSGDGQEDPRHTGGVFTVYIPDIGVGFCF
jgi:hypothetical protein